MDCYPLDWESVTTFLHPPPTDPLFPNLRYLFCNVAAKSMPLLSMPFPSLVSLDLHFVDEVDWGHLRDSLESVSRFSRNIKKLCVRARWQPETTFCRFFSSYTCQWQNLQTLLCDDIALNMDALAHLSRMPALTRLTFSVDGTLLRQIELSASPLLFSNLCVFTLCSENLDPISRFLSRTRLLAVTDFTASIKMCPSKLDISSFFAGLQTSSTGHIIQGLGLYQNLPSNDPYVPTDPRPVLTLEDLQPCMAFTNLCSMYLDIEWDVGLTGNDLLILASAWPQLGRSRRKRGLGLEYVGWNLTELPATASADM